MTTTYLLATGDGGHREFAIRRHALIRHATIARLDAVDSAVVEVTRNEHGDIVSNITIIEHIVC